MDTELDLLLALEAEPLYPTNSYRLILSFTRVMLERQRLYSSATRDDIVDLANRFVRNHAVASSPDPNYKIARVPNRILETPPIRLLTWQNGAVVHFAGDPEHEREIALWVDESTAQRWGYPEHCGWFITEADAELYLKQTQVQLALLRLSEPGFVHPVVRDDAHEPVSEPPTDKDEYDYNS